MSDDEHRIDPDEHREVLLPVIERWFPDDDAPYNRVDELLGAARAAGFEPGVKEWAVDWWTGRVVDAEAERDRLRAALEMIAVPPVHVTGVSEGCEGCAGIARAALDGTDFTGPASIALEAVDDVDRLRAALSVAQNAVAFFASVIKSGETWTPTCEEALRATLDGGGQA